MKPEGYYYLHENKDLIYKPYDDGRIADFRESDLVRAFWPLNVADRAMAWQLLIEAAAAGAKESRINGLASLWQCDDKDAQIYAEKIGVMLQMDGNKFHATKLDYTNPMESPEGFGDTALWAMVDLCKALEFKPTKLNWHSNFHDLVSAGSSK